MPDYSMYHLMGKTISSDTSLYEVKDILGTGAFGAVAKCIKKPAGRTVALKIIKDTNFLEESMEEVEILRTLKDLGSKNFNIVQWNESFMLDRRLYLEFEILDISLWKFIQKNPLDIPQIRPIIQQLAFALSFLKFHGFIHTDLKTENIMMVNHVNQPLKVKVIDFGLATKEPEKWTAGTLQTLWYRCPEILFGAPFTAAIDIWSLGCIAAEMFLGSVPFPGDNAQDMVKLILTTLGMPPNDLLDAGQYSSDFFIKEDIWTLRPNVQDAAYDLPCPITSLSDLLMIPYTSEIEDQEAEECDRRAFVDLLEKMLSIDPQKRITPEGIIFDKFITLSHISSRRNNKYVNKSFQLMNLRHPEGSEEEANVTQGSSTTYSTNCHNDGGKWVEAGVGHEEGTSSERTVSLDINFIVQGARLDQEEDWSSQRREGQEVGCNWQEARNGLQEVLSSRRTVRLDSDCNDRGAIVGQQRQWRVSQVINGNWQRPPVGQEEDQPRQRRVGPDVDGDWRRPRVFPEEHRQRQRRLGPDDDDDWRRPRVIPEERQPRQRRLCPDNDIDWRRPRAIPEERQPRQRRVSPGVDIDWRRPRVVQEDHRPRQRRLSPDDDIDWRRPRVIPEDHHPRQRRVGPDVDSDWRRPRVIPEDRRPRQRRGGPDVDSDWRKPRVDQKEDCARQMESRPGRRW